MVHIGAIVASLTTSLPGLRDLPAINLPGPQREWVGMGAAAGVATCEATSWVVVATDLPALGAFLVGAIEANATLLTVAGVSDLDETPVVLAIVVAQLGADVLCSARMYVECWYTGCQPDPTSWGAHDVRPQTGASRIIDPEHVRRRGPVLAIDELDAGGACLHSDD